MLGKIKHCILSIIKKIVIPYMTKKTKIDVRELYTHLNGDKGFSRYDMIVRYLAIEDYYGENDYGFELYRKMQSARNGADTVKESVERFKLLIESYRGGYDKNSTIELARDLQLMDGSHRFALALYTKNYEVSCLVRHYIHTKHIYDIRWFKVNGFTDKEIEILENKNKEIALVCEQPFICTLWSPAKSYFEEITNHLSLWGDIVGVADYQLDSFTYNQLVKKVYAIDDIADWKVDYKIEKMARGDEYKIRVVKLLLRTTNFRLKGKTLNTLSTEGEEIKKSIREAYKNRIENYFHDIIIHMGDNLYQNEYMERLFCYDSLNIEDVFEQIKGYRYVITKFDTPYMPKDFPKNFPLGKDVDIICETKADFISICREVEKLEGSCSPFKMRTVRKTDKENAKRVLYRIELRDELIFLFDVMYGEQEGLSDKFISNMMNKREKRGAFYLPCRSDEIIVRLNEYKLNPKKEHHLSYVLDNLDHLNEKEASSYLAFNYKEIIKNKK